MAQEGAFQFGSENWGPQPIRVLMANNGGAINLAVGVAGDLDIKEYSDLKGKRVAQIGTGASGIQVAQVSIWSRRPPHSTMYLIANDCFASRKLATA